MLMNWTKLIVIQKTTPKISSSLVSILFLIFSRTSACFVHSSFCGSKQTFKTFFSSSSSTTNETPEDKSMTSPAGLQFGRFLVSPSQVFYRSPAGLTAAIVNLKPIVPGHVLVVPIRVVPRLHQLTSSEYEDLFQSVRVVQEKIEFFYNASGSNVAIQDGVAAGQSVPHVHVHILPRVQGDFERNDDVYDALEAWGPNVSEENGTKEATKLEVKDDDDRIPRTMDDMGKEAANYRRLF